MKRAIDMGRRVPAPWTLYGHAFAFLISMPEDDLRDRCFIHPDPSMKRKGRLSVFMYVNYASSDVGAYHELMFIPARYDYGCAAGWTIGKIYVSSMESLVNGRENWGIPKELAEFDCSISHGGSELMQARSGNTTFAKMEFVPFGPSFPVTSSLVPAFLRTLAHRHNGALNTVAPNLRCTARLGKISRMEFNQEFFPDLTRGRIILGGYLGNFTFVFPPARIIT